MSLFINNPIYLISSERRAFIYISIQLFNISVYESYFININYYIELNVYLKLHVYLLINRSTSMYISIY